MCSHFPRQGQAKVGRYSEACVSEVRFTPETTEDGIIGCEASPGKLLHYSLFVMQYMHTHAVWVLAPVRRLVRSYRAIAFTAIFPSQRSSSCGGSALHLISRFFYAVRWSKKWVLKTARFFELGREVGDRERSRRAARRADVLTMGGRAVARLPARSACYQRSASDPSTLWCRELKLHTVPP